MVASLIDIGNTKGKADFGNFGKVEFEALGRYPDGVVQQAIN